MDKLWLITRMILKRLFKRPSSILLHLVLPVVSSIGLFLLVSMNSGANLDIGVANLDQSSTSYDLMAVIDNNKGFKVHETDAKDMSRSVSERRISYGIVIPSGFEEALLRGESPDVKLYAISSSDQTDWMKQSLNTEIDSYVQLAAKSTSKEDYQETLRRIETGGIIFESGSLTDESVEKNALVQTFGTYMLLLMISSFMISFRILDEKARGTFTRIGMSSVHPRIYIVANTLAGLLVAMLQIALVLAGLLALGSNFYAPVALVYLVLVVFALCSISISVLVAVVSKSSNEANASIGFIVSPSCMLAGCLWPIRFMPDFLQKLAYLLPQRWTLDAVILLQRQASLVRIIPNLLVVLGFTVLFVLLAVYKLKSEDQVYA